ncbi:hypothetical protein FHL15_006818 [Xylaria flabelliformis]|uniref:Uncharacterized protein n=1 Tax=Xylaria flabelliformis TaxID=2512241 RepID=A0A553HW89_9PEZI|nr:hypothetical protein FHL15_006818 [Xylaria flabelliformis]
MAETSEHHGSLVAFEGPQDIISTQLRLLPTSPKILILPSFQYFVKDNDTNAPFDARSQILRTHEACDARTEMARNFLRESTPDNKRLVFMNGGTASAQLSCISAISKHETNGDIIKAEAIFSELIQDGIAGLKRESKPEEEVRGNSPGDAMTDINERDNNVPDDPISRAMRAADALDLETAFLQDTNDLDPMIASRPRSTSVPILPAADDLQSSTPFYLLNPTNGPQSLPRPGSIGQGQLLYVEKWRAMTATEDQIPDPNNTPRSPNCNSEIRPFELLRPTSAVGPPRAAVESTPGSPALVGEARLVDIRSFIPSTHKRTKSVDRIYATAIRDQDIALCNFPQSASAKLENNAQEKENSPVEKPVLRSNFYREAPYSIIIKPNRSIVRNCLPSPLNLGIRGPKQPPLDDAQAFNPGRDYVHRGTITDPILDIPETGTENDFKLGTDELFQTVLPMVEDLIIHFKVEESEPRLEAMIQAFKLGRYPISMPPLLPESKENANQVDTPTTGGLSQERAEEGIQHSISIYSSDEYDPFAAHGDYLGSRATPYVSKQDIGGRPQEISVSTPPILSQVQSQGSNTPSDKIFHDFDLKECKTAVCIQNSLRSILNVHFPSENTGYHQFNFPLLPELNNLWRPVFREAPSEDSKATRKIDLILAIASTMQAFTSQPLANQTQDNPFSNPVLLATLIIPHLETYIAAHSGTRFFILDYPPEYLSTVMALQHLIGMDLFKVAGIIDAEAGDRRSSSAYRTRTLPKIAHSRTNSASKGTGPTLPSPKGPKPTFEAAKRIRPSQSSFSKANFVLTSTATESEIATLISTIWRILIEISPSYIPDNSSRPNSQQSQYTHNFSSPSPIGSKEQYPPLFRAAVMLGFARMPEDELRAQPHNYVSSGTYADLPAPTQRPVTPNKASKASITETYHSSSNRATSRTPRTTQIQRNKLRHLLGCDTAALDAASDAKIRDEELYCDFDDEGEHGQFAAEERKYMPLWSQENGLRKGNRSKALKWLGLAT